MSKKSAILYLSGLVYVSPNIGGDQAARNTTLCPYSQEQVEKDSIIYSRKKYSGSTMVITAHQNKNMESYYALCGPQSNENYAGNYAKLFEENYPNYIKIQQEIQNIKNAQLEKRPPIALQNNAQVRSSGSQTDQSIENKPTLQPHNSKLITNPACLIPEIKVEEDSKAKLKREYPDSFSTQNMLHNSNMKSFHQVCDKPLPEPLQSSAKRLFDQYYPSYSTIELLLKAELKSYNDLDNAQLEKRAPLAPQSNSQVNSFEKQKNQAYVNKPAPQSKSLKPVNINPACPFSEEKVKEDSIAKFKKEYPDSFSAQNMLHKANINDFHQVCDNPLPEPLQGSAKRLFDQYYPSYSTIELLLRAELKSYNELNNAH